MTKNGEFPLRTSTTVGREAVLAGVIAAHAVVTAVHGAAHQAQGIELTLAQGLFVALVVVLAPLYGAWLHWRARARSGLALMAAALFAADVFGVVNHLWLAGDDNVRLHPVWRAAHPSATGWLFDISAMAVLLTETAGALIAVWCLALRAGKVRAA